VIREVSNNTLQDGLPQKLHAIASRHGGEVPLHGRLFAQWLHFAFPHECPYPSVLQSATALTANQWQAGQSVATEQERQKHVESSSATATPSAEDFDIEGRWSDHEVLPVHTQPNSGLLLGSGTLRTVVQLVAVVVALRSALAAWRTRGAGSGDVKGKKNDDFVGSLHV